MVVFETVSRDGIAATAVVSHAQTPMRLYLSRIEQRPSKPWVGGSNPFRRTKFMVGIVQWLERQIVALEVVGSTPITHPIFPFWWGVAKW